jgi:hypothetical protein
MKRLRYLRIWLICAVLLLGASLPAWAAPVTHGNIVSFNDIYIEPDITVENVIVVGGNATIAGTVTDEVVVISGNVKLDSTASIRDRVIVLGGDLYSEDGARIGKGVFRIGGNFPFAATLISAATMILILWTANILVTVGLTVLPLFFTWGWKRGVQDLSEIVKTSPLKTMIVGIFGGLAALIVMLIFAITLFGIPVAGLLALLITVAIIAGLSGICHAVGQSFPVALAGGERSVFVNTLYGTVVLALIFNVPLVGTLVLLLSCTAALGAVLIKFFTTKQDAF